MGEWITVTANDGGKFKAYVAKPSKGSGPGLVLCQEIFGVNAHIRELADNYAEEGYVTIAPDLFWRLKPGIELKGTDADMPEAFGYYQKFDVTKSIEDIAATVKALRALPEFKGKVGAVGFCLGGKLAYLMATRSNSDCNVSYYGVGIDTMLDEAAKITRPLMLHIAEKDKFVPPEAQAKVKAGLAGNPHVTIHSYPDVDHAFARIGGQHYEKAEADLANGRTRDFFKQHLG